MNPHMAALQELRVQRYKALTEALSLRSGGRNHSLRVMIRGLIAEVRALNVSLFYVALDTTHHQLLDTLRFYADPETYDAIGFVPDPPAGVFMSDFSETVQGFRPGKRARVAFEMLSSSLRGSVKEGS